MTTALQPLNLSDFTGGLNLRGDAFQLKDNESPEMLNVDVDPRGGVRSRRGWKRYNAAAITGTWLPQRLHIYEKPDGTRAVMLVTNSLIQTAAAGTFSSLSDGSGAVAAAAATHGADFADWNTKTYIACGRPQVARSWVGSGAAVKLLANGPTFQNDYLAPVGGYFPQADFVTSYQGYMVCASTRENGVDYPNRVRFSHPNNPENWADLDRIDIAGGGSNITGIVAFSDHVLVFKTNSVWAIYGNDAESFVPVNVTMALGAIHRNAICVTDSGAYFYSHPNGVHEYRPGEGVREISSQLRPMIDGPQFAVGALSRMSLGFLNRRLWWSVPYDKELTATTARSTFVYDPSLESWTLYKDADGDGVGPFATGGNQGNGALLLAAHSVHSYVVALDAEALALDTIDTVGAGFKTLYATRWLHADWPSLRKSWRRPDYVVTEESSAWRMDVGVFRDYDESTARSSHTLIVQSGGGGVWGVGVWGVGVWGGTPSGAHIERGGSIGLAKSIQLKFSGEVGKPWGLNAVVCKFRPRRFK